MNTENKLSFRLISSLLVFLFLVACYARPNETDREEVKRHFLNLRFLAPFFPETANMTDIQLFEKSCLEKRVICGELLEDLKKKDPIFFEALTKK